MTNMESSHHTFSPRQSSKAFHAATKLQIQVQIIMGQKFLESRQCKVVACHYRYHVSAMVKRNGKLPLQNGYEIIDLWCRPRFRSLLCE